MLPWAHPSLQPKRHLDLFSHFCTAHGKVSWGMLAGTFFPLKSVPSYGGSVLNVKTCKLIQAFCICEQSNVVASFFVGHPVDIKTHTPEILSCTL